MSGSNDISLAGMLIAAYKDGIKIADRIKRKRAEQGAEPPPPELEKALRDGEARITEVRDENRDVKVDIEAQMALKDLIIEVQGTLLRQLGEAEQDISFDDFSETIQTAVRTRRKAINVLNDLYQRAEDEALQLKKSQRDANAIARAKQEEDEKRQRLLEEDERKQRLMVEEERKRCLVAEEENKRQLAEEEESKRRLFEEEENKRRLLEEERQRRLLEEEQKKRRLFEEEEEKRSRLLRQESQILETSRSLPIPIEQTPREDSGRRRFWSIRSRTKRHSEQYEEQHHSLPRTNTNNTITRASVASEQAISLSIGSPDPPAYPHSPPLSASPQHPAVSPSVPIKPLSKSSNVGGFCQGAWYAQNLRLDKATGKPSLRAYGWAFFCKKCNFRLQADMRDRDRPRFDDRIYQTQTTRFRLLFLLKSHLPVKTARAPRVYACMLCALAGTTKHCHGEDHLIEHVQHHAKETYGETCLEGPVSIGPDGVHVESNASFDIVFGNRPPDDEDIGGAQYLDGREVEFSLPPPAELGQPPPVELDASEPTSPSAFPVVCLVAIAPLSEEHKSWYPSEVSETGVKSEDQFQGGAELQKRSKWNATNIDGSDDDTIVLFPFQE
ncbi:hypothetical protein DV738_g2, partial [Chaetothyriales sp. CBS 135597]